jgi:cytidyltransferase-like protein
MVSGVFDLLHSGHVAFLRHAAELAGAGGELHACVASDRTAFGLRGRFPTLPERERLFLVESVKGVTHARLSSGSGVLDFEPELRAARPDLFVVNADGDLPAKRALVESVGCEYRVLPREPAAGLAARSSDQLRGYEVVPYRIDLAGGWLDQPFVSKHTAAGGPVLVCSIEPTHEFNLRSGMASSTRGAALRIWSGRLPVGNRETLARTLFACDNPPGTKDIAGSQDAIGIVYPGVNKLHYAAGQYWPASIDSRLDEDTLRFLESHLQLVAIGPRKPQFEVLAKTEITPAKAEALAEAANRAWERLLAHDAAGFGKAMADAMWGQVAMFPYMMTDEIAAVIDRCGKPALGYKITGAGGGGYVVVFGDKPIDGAIRVRIRRD